jgi:hypothetical protein
MMPKKHGFETDKDALRAMPSIALNGSFRRAIPNESNKEIHRVIGVTQEE